MGRATAIELALRGWDIALGFRSNEEAARSVAASLHPESRSVLVQGDVATDAADMVARAVEGLGGLDAVIFTAVPIITGRLSELQDADIDSAMGVTVHGFRGLALAARPFLAESEGSVVAFSSLGSERYAAYYGAIAPAKGALEAMIRYIAVEFGRYGVTVNGISPCLIDDVQHFDEAPTVLPHLEQVAKRTPLRRKLVTPADVARVACALVGPDFSTVTGQLVKVDGGYSLLA
ncbi:MAG: SDR family oxidoreductase [Actinomycetota bacterium]|nr:SDR family oxidoreductase [Actinomycetota bacterium]